MTIDIQFEFDELIYDTTEGGIPMVMVCVNLVSGVLALRDIQVNVQPKASDPVLDSATRKLLCIHQQYYFIDIQPSSQITYIDQNIIL